MSASTTYNSTVNIAANKSDCSIAWTIYYGCVSTNDKISGSNSAQMRWYSSATSNIPYAKTTTAIDGLSNVALKARTSSTDVKMDVCYSANGTDWTVGKTHTFTETGKGEDVSLAIPSGNKYVKFEVSSSSTAPSSGNYKLIIDDVVFTYTGDKETPTWSLDPTSATVEAGSNTTLQLTTNYDGTLTFESEDTDIATVSYNSSTKVITVNGIAAGSTTITATGAATSTYEAVSKNITVTVTHPELASNFMSTMGPLGYSYFGLTPSGSNTYVNLDDSSISNEAACGIEITFDRNGSSNTKLRFDVKYARFYSGNTLTVAAPSGSYITKIVFTEPSSDKSWSGSMTTASVGDYVSSEKTWYATATGVTSVVFTNDATKRIGGLEIYLNVSTIPVSISSAKYATFSDSFARDFSASGITVYAATATASSVSFDEVTDGIVPANTGVVLYSADIVNNAAIPVATTDASYDFTDNEMVANVAVTNIAYAGEGDKKNYILANGGNGVGFYKAAVAGANLGAHKAYLSTATAAAARDFLGFEENTTGIEKVESAKQVAGEYYNLAGQRVAKPTKGLYIVNGKKVIK